MRILAVLLLASTLAFGSASAVYITQNGAGTKDGTSLANAGACDAVANTPQTTCAFFNNPANWGTGATQIGAGTTVHLNGVITAAQSTTASYLDFQGSGASGNVITLAFDSGAVLQSTAFNIAIDTASQSYITIDGGANGVIQNTGNGTLFTFHQSSEGVHIAASFFVEVKNLTIQSIYQNAGNVNTATDTAGAGTEDIRVDANNGNITIDHNTVSAARTGIDVAYTTAMNHLYIFSNTSTDHTWGIRVVENTAGATSSDIQIHDNTITNWTNWQWPTNTYHTDGIIVYGQQNSDLVANIYNNYVYGNLGSGSPTGLIFCTYGSGPPGSKCYIFNNVLNLTGGSGGAAPLWLQSGGLMYLYNNTIQATGKTIYINTNSTQVTLQNNIIQAGTQVIASYATTGTVFQSQIVLSNNNVLTWANGANTGNFAEYNEVGTPLGVTWAAWQAYNAGGSGVATDNASSNVNPGLNGSFEIALSSSSAYGRGANLTSLNITALDSDKLGISRNTWDAGAYSYQCATGTLAQESGASSNNSAACGSGPQSYCTTSFAGMSNTSDVGAQTTAPNPAPGNVSTMDIHALLPANTKVVAHFMGWFTSTGTGDHTQTHYNSNDANTVAAQMADMIARHLDGLTIDWYGEFNSTTDGTTQKVNANLSAKCTSPQNCPLEYALIEDQGAVTRVQGSRAACSTTDAACLQASILQDLCYANANYFGQNAYLKVSPITYQWKTSTNPLVGFFPPSTTTAWNTAVSNLKALTAANGWAATNCPAGQQQANGGLVFFDSDTTNVAEAPYSGGSSWVDVQPWSSSNQFLWDGTGNNTYHESLYSSCTANPSQMCIGSAKKGFNDSPTPPFASWGTNRVMAQECGQVWLNSLAKASLFTGTYLTLQLVTWNDDEEGTEIETGVDNCYYFSAAPTLSGNTLNWSAALSSNDSTYAAISAGQPSNGTADHWKIWVCPTSPSAECPVIANEPLSTLSVDLSTLPIPLGTWQLYVQLYGKPDILNQMSSPVSYTH